MTVKTSIFFTPVFFSLNVSLMRTVKSNKTNEFYDFGLNKKKTIFETIFQGQTFFIVYALVDAL